MPVIKWLFGLANANSQVMSLHLKYMCILSPCEIMFPYGSCQTPLVLFIPPSSFSLCIGLPFWQSGSRSSVCMARLLIMNIWICILYFFLL